MLNLIQCIHCEIDVRPWQDHRILRVQTVRTNLANNRKKEISIVSIRLIEKKKTDWVLYFNIMGLNYFKILLKCRQCKNHSAQNE